MKVSVALCTYNGEKFIEEQLNSILNQTIKPDEIVLCDDISKDRTIEIARRVLDNSGVDYKIIVNETNQGVVKNFSNAISNCTGDIVFTSDQDDVWMTDKVEKMISYFKEHPNCKLLFSNSWVTDGSLNPITDLWTSIKFTPDKQKFIFNKEPYKLLFAANYVTGAVMAVDREFAVKSLPVPEVKNCLHDAWFALVAPVYGEIGCIDEKLINYRQHGNNVAGVRTDRSIKARIGYFKADAKLKERLVPDMKVVAERLLEIATSNNYSNVSEIKGWCDFLTWQDNLKNKNGFVAFFSIIGKFITGKYNLYQNKHVSALQDIFNIF